MAGLRPEELLNDEILKTAKMTYSDQDLDQGSSSSSGFPIAVEELSGENPATIIIMQESE